MPRPVASNRGWSEFGGAELLFVASALGSGSCGRTVVEALPGRDAAEGGRRTAATEGAAPQASRLSPKQPLVTGYAILDGSTVQELYSHIMLATFSDVLGEEYQSKAISLTICSGCCSLLSSLLSGSIDIDQHFLQMSIADTILSAL